jgi:hypothetical protein
MITGLVERFHILLLSLIAGPEEIADYLALEKGVQPTGSMVESMKVRRYTVVAKSFHGRPGRGYRKSALRALFRNVVLEPPYLRNISR